MLVAAFVPPDKKSPFHESFTGITWYIVTTIGLSAPLWGLLYYAGLRLYGRHNDKELVVTRTPFRMHDPDCPGEYVQKAEIIDHVWQRRPRAGFSTEDGWEMKTGAVIGTRNRDDSESTNSGERGGVFGRILTGSGARRPTGLRDERRLSGGFEE